MNKTLLVISGAFLMASCDSGTEIITPVLPHSPVDEGWKAVENLEYAFNMKDLDLLDETLDQDFGLALQEEDWDDYDGDGIIDSSLNEEYFLQTVSCMFNGYEVIELILSGSGEIIWPGDPTGETLQYQRSYSMKAYNWVGGQQEGWSRLGETSFLCKADETGIWHVTGIEDTTEE